LFIELSTPTASAARRGAHAPPLRAARVVAEKERTTMTWTLVRTDATHVDLQDSSKYGHRFTVSFTLHYQPRGGRFVEMPELYWGESFVLKDDSDRTYWDFEAGNMYARKPGSPTFFTWTRRYSIAYDAAARRLGTGAYAYVLDHNHHPVDVRSFGVGLRTADEQAEAVRCYLQAYGGTMIVRIPDEPSIVVPPRTPPVLVRKERLLNFRCGLVGFDPQHVFAAQRLYVDSRSHPSSWRRYFTMHTWRTPMDTAGYDRVLTPDAVARVDLVLTGGFG
jgi:hypothetical protein